jgi:hypothetical protein
MYKLYNISGNKAVITFLNILDLIKMDSNKAFYQVISKFKLWRSVNLLSVEFPLRIIPYVMFEWK